ncbi:MAG: cysteine desulfurase NifS [Deltaproteobacteria bacterium]|nr:cysteine desulfurase NifS [Deltaproteobacteria bacterium]
MSAQTGGKEQERWIYLDNNATTGVAPEVLEAMMPFFGQRYGNASSMHSFGGLVRRDLDRGREEVAALLGAHPAEIVFTSCGTEGDNHAILGTLRANPGKRHVVTSRVEHPAVRSLVRALAEQGYSYTEVGVDAVGRLVLDEVREAIRPDTALLSFMWANNETGVIFPVEELAQIAHARGIVFHTDAVQAVGKLPIDLGSSAIDLLTLSGHKLHAPKGVGALYVRRGTKLFPFLVGGHQEDGRRGGTENVPGIVALGEACRLARLHLDEEQTRVRRLRNRLEEGLLARARDALVNGDRQQRLPNTSNISFRYIEGEAILLLLDRFRIAASSGSACTSGSLEPSHVLRAMGVPYTAAHGSIRFSLSRYNVAEEIERVIEVLPPIVERLRAISPFGRGDERTWTGQAEEEHRH